jgi:hypothetical protein
MSLQVSKHALRRYLERVKGHKMKQIDDSAALQSLKDRGFDLKSVLDEIIDLVPVYAIDAGVTCVKSKGFKLIIKDRTVISVVPTGRRSKII